MLKRSEKFCTKCNEKNPIRSFQCKKCSHNFPQKEKPIKQVKANQQVSENRKIEEFLRKKDQIKDNSTNIKNNFTNQRGIGNNSFLSNFINLTKTKILEGKAKLFCNLFK